MPTIPPPRASGIYRITCIPNGKIYIGSSVNLRKRFTEHWRDMKGGRHDNPYLQRAWDKYGPDAFVFEVIELVMFPEYVIEREQFYLDTLNPCDRAIGFNMCKVAGSTSGREVSDETRRRLCADPVRRAPRSAETRQRMVEAQSHIPPRSDAHRKNHAAALRGHVQCAEEIKKRADANRGRKRSADAVQNLKDAWQRRPRVARHVVTTPQGEELLVHLPTFCREHGISYKNLIKYVGTSRQYKGYAVRRATE